MKGDRFIEITNGLERVFDVLNEQAERPSTARRLRRLDVPEAVTLGYVDRTTMTTGLGPTLELTGDVPADMDRIRSFYAAHAQLIVAQQILGILALIPLVAFAAALQRRFGGRQWLLAGAALVVVAEASTNVPPLILALSRPSAQAAHGLTAVEDVADAALFACVALFALVVALKSGWLLRVLGLVVAGLTLARAVATPLAPPILDTAAPIAFLALVLAVSVHMLIRPGERQR